MEQRPSIYKIGMKVYEDKLGNVDRNSGTYEANYIANALRGIAQTIVDSNTLIIIGGKLFEEDNEKLNELMPEFDRCIFIATDSVNFDTCDEIIRSCDYILHQSPKEIQSLKPQFGIDRQMYGYVPELFYMPMDKVPHQKAMAIFGGNNYNRQDKFDEYLLGENGTFKDGTFALYKTSGKDAEDFRLEYASYIQLSRMFKYNLIIVRDEYRELGWVTSRFVESAMCWNYPIVDISYDKYNHFCSGLRKVESYDEMVELMKYYDAHEDERVKAITSIREKLMLDCNKFTEVIYDICTR